MKAIRNALRKGIIEIKEALIKDIYEFIADLGLTELKLGAMGSTPMITSEASLDSIELVPESGNLIIDFSSERGEWRNFNAARSMNVETLLDIYEFLLENKEEIMMYNVED